MGIIFDLVPQEVATTGFIITEAKNKIVIHFPSNSASPDTDQQVGKALKKLADNAKKKMDVIYWWWGTPIIMERPWRIKSLD